MTETKTTRRRARTSDGHFRADDPKTPNVNEAWEVLPAKEKPKPVQKKEASSKPEPEVVWFESREKEATMFPVAGVKPVRNFSNGRLEYKVRSDDVERFSSNHFVVNGRIVRKV